MERYKIQKHGFRLSHLGNLKTAVWILDHVYLQSCLSGLKKNTWEFGNEAVN